MFVFFLLDLILFSLLTTRSLSIEQGVRTARTIEGTDLSSIACLRRKDALEQKIARNLLRRSQSSTTSAAVMFRIPVNVNRKSVITPSLIRIVSIPFRRSLLPATNWNEFASLHSYNMVGIRRLAQAK